MGCRKRSISNDADMLARLHKEWDEASCPICMDHPHNAVLLLCSSHDKGCRSYICDTSYRHSNCLDRFKELKDENNVAGGMINETPAALIMEDNNDSESSNIMSNLKCPLCRGSIIGWKVVEEARRYLNLKQRSCTRESCSYCGDYSELRFHARRVHPSARPADVDRSRQRAWRRLETQSEYDDIVTAIRSAMPGAIVVGDYVIENPRDRTPVENGRSLSRYLLFHMIDSMDSTSQLRGGRSGAISRHRRSPGGFSRRRYIWGENLLGDDTEVEDDLELGALNDAGEGTPSNPRRRQRRRFTRTRADYG